ncbi:hypothetical protein [Candidatus Pelagisphaera phototrophica]|nr:hypothetical protein [Candidatus Pelagisphaera phototrophica]
MPQNDYASQEPCGKWFPERIHAEIQAESGQQTVDGKEEGIPFL